MSQIKKLEAQIEARDATLNELSNTLLQQEAEIAAWKKAAGIYFMLDPERTYHHLLSLASSRGTE